ncbi:MAG: ribonuclease HII, partial [Anaerolineae bacterium]|nr:ribonuclease HII [Anaerolineae bacterium]
SSSLLRRIHGVRDSKLLTARQRELLLRQIEATAVSVGVGVAPSWEVDGAGIVAATRRAMARAVRALEPRPDFILVDALRVPECSCPQLAIVKGDRLSLSIAAASVVAKVRRDDWMCMFDRAWPGYSFRVHKGYATLAHRRALASLGPSPIHRRTFAPVAALLGTADWRHG